MIRGHICLWGTCSDLSVNDSAHNRWQVLDKWLHGGLLMGSKIMAGPNKLFLLPKTCRWEWLTSKKTIRSLVYQSQTHWKLEIVSSWLAALWAQSSPHHQRWWWVRILGSQLAVFMVAWRKTKLMSYPGNPFITDQLFWWLIWPDTCWLNLVMHNTLSGSIIIEKQFLPFCTYYVCFHRPSICSLPGNIKDKGTISRCPCTVS